MQILTTFRAIKAIAFERLFKSAITVFLRNRLVVSIKEYCVLPLGKIGMCYAVVACPPMDTYAQC